MKNKFIKFLSIILVVLTLFSTMQNGVSAASLAQENINEIIDFNLSNTGSGSVQEWINTDISNNISLGTEWYVMALSQYKNYDFTKYKQSLLKYIKNNNIPSYSSKIKYALTLIAIGDNNSYISTALNQYIGKQGIMSYVFGLHLINNGYSSNSYTKQSITNKLLSLQLSDGGFALSGKYGDVDVTAMTVQALAPQYSNNSKVKTAINKAINLLSSKQNDNGSYSSYNVQNPESTAQVLVALSALDIDALTDSRFIKKGNTVFDGIDVFKLKNNSYSHTKGGAYNINATMQVFYSMVSYLRMKNGQSDFYIFDNRSPQSLSANTNNNSNKITTNNTGKNNSSKITESKKEKTNKTAKTSDLTKIKDGKTIKQENNSASISNEKTNEKAKNNASQNKTNYKIYVVIVLIVLSLLLVILLIIFKKFNIKNLVAVILSLALLTALTFYINIESPKNYYNSSNINTKSIGSVTISISISKLKGKTFNDEKITNEYILPKTKVEIYKDNTVYDVLLNVSKQNKIKLETNGSKDSVYIEGINDICEFSFGDLSGWVYFINKKTTSKSAGSYILKDGDNIEWHYSLNMGNDIY